MNKKKSNRNSKKNLTLLHLKNILYFDCKFKQLTQQNKLEVFSS